MKRYCLGFMFSPSLERVLLIMKNRGPNNQAGKLNGLGGEARDNERLVEAMSRKFQEESSLDVGEERWRRFSDVDGGYGSSGYTIGLFYTVSADLEKAVTTTDEPLYWQYVSALDLAEVAVGVKWMIEMARSHARGEDTSLYSCHRSTVLFP